MIRSWWIAFVALAAVPIAQIIQLTSMVMEGVYEKFPKLRVAYLEAGAGWVPYIDFNCEGGEVTLPYAVKRIGHRAILFATDFPHETNLERAKAEIEELMHHKELSDEAKQALFHDNVVRFYGPRAKLQ